MAPKEPLYISPEDAIDVLNATDCFVKLNIATGIYPTEKGIENNLIYVKLFGDYVHIRNIEKIQSPKGEMITIDWDHTHIK